MKMKASNIDHELLSEYERNYNQGVIFIGRKDTLQSKPKKVNVCVDGTLTNLPVDMFNRLIESGFYEIVGKKAI